MNWNVLLKAVVLQALLPSGSLVSGFTAEYFVSIVGSLVHGFFNSKKDPSLSYNAEELIMHAGYPAETHQVLTQDGVLLTLHRIPPKTTNSTNVKDSDWNSRSGFRPKSNPEAGKSVKMVDSAPVLILHGVLSASDSWLLQGPGYDLAYLLSDAGYDVWLGNCRGSYYSKAHKNISILDDSFWNFSFHEMGYYDLPAVIDHILNVTQKDKLFYIGHSMGTTMFFVMATTRPEYNNKIRLFAGLAPAVNFHPDFRSPEKKVLFDILGKIVNIFDESHILEILPRANWMPLLVHAICREELPFQAMCIDIVFFWAGVQSKLIQQKKIETLLSHVPSGVSLKTVKHYMQLLKTGKFQQYDYGPEKNMIKYGQRIAPEYNLSLVTCPTSLHYSTGDFLVDAQDVAKLIKKLKTVKNVQKTARYNHIDFLWAYNARSLVYSEIINVMKKY